MLMRSPISGAGRNTVLAGAALLALAGCGTKPSPLPPNQSFQALPPDVLALSGRDTLTQARFEKAAKQAGVPAKGEATNTLGFWDEYVRYSLESQAAQDDGIYRDSSRQKRWASIRERILSDRYNVDILQGQFGYQDAVLDSVIASDSALKKLGKDSVHVVAARKLVLRGIKLDSVMKANPGQFRKPDSTFPSVDSVRAKIESLVLSQRSQKENSSAIGRLKAAYKVEVTKPVRPAVPQDSLLAFYRRNLDRWSGSPLYILSAIGTKDSAALRQVLSGKKRPTTKEAFQALAAKFPVGTPAAPKGELGRVRRNFALPYGLGMVPDLFVSLDTAKLGLVGPVRSDSTWYAFWYERKDTAVTKPFDAVVEDVRSQYLAEHPWTPSPSTVVARWDRGVLFTKADVDFISEEIPANVKRQFPFERVLEFMVHWKVGARAGIEAGELGRPTVQALLRDNEAVYWSQAWRASKEAVAFLQPDSALASAWKNGKALFPRGVAEDTLAGVNRDAARLSIMPEGFLKERYVLRSDLWMRDSVLPSFDSVSGRIFRQSREELDQMGRAHIDSVLKARYHFHAFASAPHPHVYASLSQMFDSARTAYDRRDLDVAEALFRRIEKDYPNGDTLYDKALFQLGQLLGEKQNYLASLEAYRKLLWKRPASPEAYKAQFMIAFTYSEYLKKEKLALAEYRKVLANYPNCELAKDADWMIRNIESGGALMPKFDDSVTVDTSKSPAAKPTSTTPVAKPSAAAAVPASSPAVATKPAAGVRKIGGVSVKTLAPSASPADSTSGAQPR
jgi:tetratricopeptide (TPR) repeat protein